MIAHRILNGLKTPVSIVLLVTLLMLVVCEVMRPGFAQPGQLISLLRVAAFLGIIAAGQTLVIISGNDGIDLSVGAVVTASAILVYALNATYGLPLAILIALSTGAFAGLINGLGVAYLRLPPLIMTLGTAGVINGLVLVLTEGRPTGSEAGTLTAFVTQPWLLGIPGCVFLWAALAILLHVILRRTVWGRRTYAFGSNSRAAHLSGIRTGLHQVSVYIVASILAALGGVVLLGYTGSVFLNLGEAYTLPSVATVVVGGTLLAGGIGNYWGSVAGALMLTVLQSLLIALGLPEFARQIAYGLLLACALCAYSASGAVGLGMLRRSRP